MTGRREAVAGRGEGEAERGEEVSGCSFSVQGAGHVVMFPELK